MNRADQEEVSCFDPARGIEMKLRVRYFETDQMGFVHHAHYLVWFESARSEFCRIKGIAYSEMERNGLALPIIEAQCRYMKPARYDDDLIVRAWVTERHHSLLRMRYEVLRNLDLLSAGWTLQALIQLSSGAVRRFPPEIAALFDS